MPSVVGSSSPRMFLPGTPRVGWLRRKSGSPRVTLTMSPRFR